MRAIGTIVEELLETVTDEKTRMLIKELNNTCGSQVSELKDKIVTDICAAQTVKVEDGEEKYIPVSTALDIVLTAGWNLK